MDEVEFDKFAAEYHALHAANIAVSGEQPKYFAEYKIKDLIYEYFAHAGSIHSPLAILDFGAGVGTSVGFLRKYLPHAEITCLDVSSKSLAVGEQRFSGQAKFVHFDGTRIPLPDATFDIAFAGCVFHHIRHSEHERLLEEMRRVLRPGGMVLIFEHNPYNPFTLHAVNTCPFDENAHLVAAPALRRSLRAAGFMAPRVCYRVFFPRALRGLRRFERAMTWCPLGAQYYVVAAR